MRGDDDSVALFMRMYWADYWRDTGALECIEHGAYLQLIGRLYDAKDCRLLFDRLRLARMVHATVEQWDAIWKEIASFFHVEDGWLTHGRVSRVHREAVELRQKQAEGGRLGADIKRRKRKGSRSPKGHLKHSYSGSESGSASGSEAEGRLALRATRLLDWALAAFSAAWKSRYGDDYVPTPAEKSSFGRILSTLPAKRVAALPVCFSRYVKDEGTFTAQEKRHSLGWFMTESGWNKYLVEVRPPVSIKEARTAAAVARFVNGGNHGGTG
jgi:uncharacterized protein YdaU (DUF1376 family)